MEGFIDGRVVTKVDETLGIRRWPDERDIIERSARAIFGGRLRLEFSPYDAIETPLQSPATLVAPRATSPASTPQEAQGSNRKEEVNNQPGRKAAPRTQQGDGDSDQDRSIIGWLRGRADQAGYSSRFGSEGR